MSTDYIFRSYRSGDEDKIIELLSLVFGGWPHIDTDLSPIEFWRWKHLKNPVHPSYVNIGFDKEKMISCHHVMVLKLKILDNTLFGSASLDFAVHPDYRGQGLASITSRPNEIKRRKDGVLFSYFITRNPKLIKQFSSSKNLEHRRPRFPIDLVNLTRIRDVELHFKNIPMKNQSIIKLGVKTLKAWNKIWNVSEYPDNLEIMQIENFGKEIDIFLDRIVNESNFMIIRSAEYLNWRYAHPDLNYRIYIVKDQKRIIGYSILRINRYNSEYPVGYIVDLVTERNREDAVLRLAAKAVEYFDDNHVNIINYLTVKGHHHIKALVKHGFLNSMIKINLYTSKKEEGVSLEGLSQVDPSTVYISWGDLDALPVGLKPYT